MEKQDPQDQDLRYQHYQQLLQHTQQLLQYNQQLLQYNQQHNQQRYERLLQHNLQNIQRLLQHNQQLLQGNQQLLQANQQLLQLNQWLFHGNQLLLQYYLSNCQQLLQSNQQLMQRFGHRHPMPFHQVPYPVYLQGSNVWLGPGPVHGIARPIMAMALNTSNAGESCTSREDNRSISDDQKVDYERRRNNEALNKSMDAINLRDQTAKLNRLFLQFQERELELKLQEILQERQNNLQNPALDSIQDPVPNYIGQEGPSSNTSRRICEEQTLSGDQQVSERDPERDSVRDPERDSVRDPETPE